MTKPRELLIAESILAHVISKLDKNKIKNIANKSVSHFRKYNNYDDKDHIYKAIKVGEKITNFKNVY